MLNFNTLYVTSKPIKCCFFESDLINVTGFYFACKGTWIIAVILGAACFEVMQMWSPWGRQCKRNSSVRRGFILTWHSLHCCITCKDSRSNIGSPAESVQMSHACSRCSRSSIWQTLRQHDSKWQRFPVDTCHPIYACLKHYHSIVYCLTGTVNARTAITTNKP